jgi:arylsulfatase A-like enzyme
VTREHKGHPLRLAALAGAGLALAEAALAWLLPPLGHPETVAGALFAMAATALFAAAVAAAVGLVHRRLAVPAALGALAALAGGYAAQVVSVSRLAGLGFAVVVVLLSWRLPGIAALLLVAAPAAASLSLDRGAGGPPCPVAGGEGAGDRPDVLLITIDTLRSDQAVDLPAAGWRTYSEAVSPAPWTYPSMLSLFTGLPVGQHGGGLVIEAERYTRTRPGLPWLAETFAAAGYRTTAFVTNSFLGRENGFDRGFQRFVHSDASVEPHALRWLAEHAALRLAGKAHRLSRDGDELMVRAGLAELATPTDRPRFTWVHLFSPHEYTRYTEAPVSGWVPETEDAAVGRRAHAANVAATAARVARLVAAIDPARSIVAVTADHGEAFGEPGYQGHGKGYSDEELCVPFAIAGPGIEPGVAPGQIATYDLGATLAAAAGLPPVLPGADVRFAGREWVEVGSPVRRLDDPTNGPFRRESAMRRAGGGLALLPPPTPGEAAEPSAGLLERLRSLGYVN